MTKPIHVDTELLATAIERDVRYVQRLVREGVLTPIGKARRKGSGGRAPMVFDLAKSIDAYQRHAGRAR